MASDEESTPKRRKTISPDTKAGDSEELNNDGTATPGKRRLMISKMVLENFKSYAGKQEIGPFHQCFTSTVGPNGSGKSNVIDAMLFVFGKRAKQLRLNKIRELIHKSDQCTPSFATVTVNMHEIIDRPDRNDVQETENSGEEAELPYDIVPDSEVVLSRTAKSDNTSIYKLNGKTTQFREIASFLKTKGVDLEHNRFLILQGEVELISMMPPKGKNEGDNDGLLEYLEDIIGSHTYVQATLEAEAKVEGLTTIRQEKLNRVKAGETETKALESAKQEAQSLLRCERDIRQNQNILYQLQRLHVNQKAEKLKDKQKELEAELQKARDGSEGAKAEQQELTESHNDQVKEYERVLEELKTTEADFTAYERRNIDLKETVKHCKETIKTLKKKANDQEQKAHKAQEKLDSATERIPELEKEIEQLEESKEEEDANLKKIEDETQQKTQGLRSELEAQKQALQPLREDRATKEAELETAQTELELIKNSATEAQARLDEATQELSNLDNTQETKQQQLEDKNADLEVAKTKLVDLEKEDGTLANNEKEAIERNKNLMTRMEEVKAAIQSKGSAKIPRAVVEILKAAKKGGPLSKVGVLGRLGDLATIDAKYDIAVSTASGSYLHHIVVHTTAGAQRCLEFLRQNNIGRVNFIPLDKMKKSSHDRQVETPEQAPRLFEKIQPMPGQNPVSIMSAIYVAVSDTLVAPDLETATRWSFDYGKRWRVVTLDGKLLESSGTMAGGGSKPFTGGMRLRNSRSAASHDDNDDDLDKESKKIEDEITKGHESLTQVRSRRKEIVGLIRKVKSEIKNLERLLPKLTMEINAFDTTRENLTNLIPQLQEKCQILDEDQQKIDRLGEKVSECQEQLDQCIAQASNLEKEVKRLQNAILDAGGAKLKKQQTKCENILKSIKDAEKGLSSSKVAMKSSEKAIKKAHEAKANAEEQINECEGTLAEKTAEFESLETDAQAVSDSYDQAKEMEAATRKALDASAANVEELKESLASFKGKEIELVGQVDAVSKSLKEYEQKSQQWDASIKKLIKKARKDERELWDDEDEEKNEKSEENEKSDERLPEELDDTDKEEKSDNDVMQEDNEQVDEDDDDQQRDEARLAASYPTYSEAALARHDKDELAERISILETERNALAKSANLGAIAEYRKKEADYLARVAELDEITEKRNAVRREHEDLRRKRLEMFMEGFSEITLKLKEMYQMITLGGDAELELVDSLDPFSEGIVFSVRPPKKSWKNISNLSGGEKTLSSLALVFALHHYKPTPLYVMDEIDAALDYKNVSIVANYIKERTKNAQFIIISLRNNMFELADRLVGIYKTENRTKSITINPDSFGVQTLQNGCTPALRNRTNSKRSTATKTSSTKPRSSSLMPTRLNEELE